MKLIPLTRPDRIQASGLPFETVDSARWAFRKRHEHGTAEAFVRIGQRIHVDPDRYHELIRQGQAAA